VPALLWEIAAKAVLYAAVLAAIGTCAIQSLLLPRLARVSSGEIEAIVRGLALVRTRTAAAVLIALGLRALTHAAAVFGWPAVLSSDALEVVAIASRWGAAWQLQVVAASIFLAASTWTGRGRSGLDASGAVVTIAGIVLCYSMPLLGHGASSRWHVLLHGTHILGAGAWAGTLMVLVLIKVPPARRLTLLRGVSPLALSGTAGLGLAGVVMAWSYLGSISDLWTTTYGQFLALKIGLFGGAAACGFVNWRRFAAERRGTAHRDHLGPVVIELVLVAVVVIVTAALTEMQHP
jgi:putative copper export protein